MKTEKIKYEVVIPEALFKQIKPLIEGKVDITRRGGEYVIKTNPLFWNMVKLRLAAAAMQIMSRIREKMGGKQDADT